MNLRTYDFWMTDGVNVLFMDTKITADDITK